MANERAYIDETQSLRNVIGNPKAQVAYTRHAEEQMMKRQIDRMDVRRVLETGTVEAIDLRPGGDETWNVRGRDLDGRDLIVVCAVFEDLIKVKIVTAFPR
jgi:hypothetical protein